MFPSCYILQILPILRTMSLKNLHNTQSTFDFTKQRIVFIKVNPERTRMRTRGATSVSFDMALKLMLQAFSSGYIHTYIYIYRDIYIIYIIYIYIHTYLYNILYIYIYIYIYVYVYIIFLHFPTNQLTKNAKNFNIDFLLNFKYFFYVSFFK